VIDIYPRPNLPAQQCPRCETANNQVEKLYFQGTHILGCPTCVACGLEFFATLPTGHSAHFPVAFTMDGKYSRYGGKQAAWLALPLIRSLQNEPAQHPDIQLIQANNGGDLLLVNCLDACFGHVFTKIWNVYLLKEKFPERKMAVLLPAQCKWLLPEGVEIWAVDLPLNALEGDVKGLDNWVKSQFPRFKTVSLGEVQVHVDHLSLDFEKILKSKRFNLDKFVHKPAKVTFIWRTDRFWTNSSFLHFLEKAAIKFGFQSWVQGILLARQGRVLGSLIKKVKRELPEVEFMVTGLGKKGKLPNGISDHRVSYINEEVESRWNHLFGQSHLVIGMHGSHMLIPTALAAGFVELLPRHKIAHLTEDIAQQYPQRLAHFLGRYLDAFTSPAMLAMHVVAILKGFGFVYGNLEKEIG
jgi:hypothetical protein